MTTIFEKIIQKKVKAEIVFENDNILAIKDIAPVAPVHLLIMPKKHIPDLQHVTVEDLSLIGEIILVAQKLAKEYGIVNGYRLLANCGLEAGQTVFHLHFHLIGGRQLINMA